MLRDRDVDRFFCRTPPRILTDADEVALAKALKERLGQLDRGEVELIPGDQVLKELFGTPAAPGPRVPGSG